MKLVLSYLNQFLADELSITQATEALERAGIEVESVVHPPSLHEDIVTATVVSLKNHPDAERLKLAEVRSGKETFSIVCGAPNIAESQRVVLARVGAELPDGTKIKPVKIRGQESQGMLCSEQELGLSDNHEGILVLGPETDEAVPLSEVFLSSHILIDTKTAANRWDLQSYMGVAQEIAPHAGTSAMVERNTALDIGKVKSEALFENQLQEEVSGYRLLHIKVKDAFSQGNSPPHIRRILELHGINAISPIVDLTNLVMLETGQPLHAFDAARVRGMVQVRFAENGEKITTLDGEDRILGSSDIVIADEQGPIALAGVMGSSGSEITGKTKEILLEIASFDSALTRKSAKRNGLRTEASLRYERGIPLKAAARAEERFISLLDESAEVEVVARQEEAHAWSWVQHIGFKPNDLNRFLGTELADERIVEHLRGLGFDAEFFDIVTQARMHLGKPYKMGARFRVDGTDAFDCSYLTDYLYSLIGVAVGHTAHQQFKNGQEVEVTALQPGDLLFRGGPWHDLNEQEREGISHVALYAGEDKIIEARDYVRDETGEWAQLPEAERVVTESPLASIVDDPQFMGARRPVDSLEGYIRVTAPWWRSDISSVADIYEEVVKVEGLENVPATLPDWQPQLFSPDSYWARLDNIKYLLRGMGLFEVTTYPFISEQDIAAFSLQAESHLKLKNPRSSEQAYLRRSLAPQLLNSIVKNSTVEKSFGFFEVAKIFLPAVDDILPLERQMLIVAYYGEHALERAKGALQELRNLGSVEAKVVEADTIGNLHPARQGHIEVRGRDAGVIGEVHPRLLKSKKLKLPVAYFEMDMSQLLEAWSEPKVEPIPVLQNSFRAITCFVAPRTSWRDMAVALETVEGVRIEYGGEYQAEEGRKVTIRVEVVAQESNLTDKEIDSRIKKVEYVLEKKLGARIDG